MSLTTKYIKQYNLLCFLLYHAGPAVTAPLVGIRRSLKDFLEGESAVLKCDVTKLSSHDLYVTFQNNSVDIPGQLYVDLPQAPGLHSISTSFSVPQSYWKENAKLTCKVNQGFSNSFESNSIGSIFGERSNTFFLDDSCHVLNLKYSLIV